ncbi:MAG: Xaa-Pro peptidase family protein [Deltaproteobacteria bacterium]|nr:Xaa-Pro peptidase family protein [Deltaproteobacteria bacterium]
MAARQDAIIVINMKNIRYLTGFSGSDGALLVSETEMILLFDGRYTNQVKREVTGIATAEYREKSEGIARIIGEKGYQHVGFEAEYCSFSLLARVRQRVDNGIQLSPLGELDAIRAIKDEYELSCIRQAAKIVAQAVTGIMASLPRNATEQDLAAEIDYRTRLAGAEAMAFATIVASGENSALPHAQPTNRVLSNGDVLLIDCGAVLGGYASDETVVFFIDRITEKQKLVYQAVKQAQEAAIQEIKAGVTARKIDRTARQVLAIYKLEEFFTHSTGHGVGLAIHEEPRLASISESVLLAGMVVTVEPGVYLPGEFGIRIEETVLVKENGCEILTNIPKIPTIINIGD